MRRIEQWIVALCGLAAGLGQAAEPPLRFRAPIEVTQPAPFVELALPASVYAKAMQPQLQDLRIVDANGQRVPFAQLTPQIDRMPRITAQPAAQIFPLAPRPAAGGDWAAPVEVRVEGDRIRVMRRPGATAAKPAASAPGWLIDLGERERDAPPPQRLRLDWSGPASFSASFRLEVSDDLRQWRSAGIGQVMALASAQGALTQPLVGLPDGGARFVRLLWFDPGAAPVLTGVQAERVMDRTVVEGALTELRFAASAEPAARRAADETSDKAAAGALHFDLGGRLPIQQIELLLGDGTRVAPVRVQGRDAVDAPWRELGRVVFYRLERDGAVSRSPPMPLQAAVRFVRVVPDARSGALDAAASGLLVQARLARLVFASQGPAPFSLLAGAADAPEGALPMATLVPGADEQRATFGQARLGEWSEVEAVARQIESERQRALWRPWLLWGLLLVGVASLGVMVWRLARGATGSSGPT